MEFRGVDRVQLQTASDFDRLAQALDLDSVNALRDAVVRERLTSLRVNGGMRDELNGILKGSLDSAVDSMISRAARNSAFM